jgi:DNA invertase Pin-like site-specific DNA recombinase
MSNEVKVIRPNLGEDIFIKKKRKTCAYARVSNELRDSSYENQIEYYTKMIEANDSWEFVKIYADKGLSGSKTTNRIGFQKMLRDAKTGKLDLIITKSISRFSRNTIDCLKYIKELKSYNTEVYFEKENIYSFDSSTEFLLTVMSSVAEEELRSVSENRRWQIVKSYKSGLPRLDKPLGYDIYDKYYFKINDEELILVKRIFELFLKEKRIYRVKRILEQMKIKTPKGKENWSENTLKYILKNPVYIGDLLLQKSYKTRDRQIRDQEELPKYYVENHHEPIINKIQFSIVQEVLWSTYEHTQSKKEKNEKYTFSGKIFCANCGSYHKRKVFYYKQQVSRITYSCSNGLNHVKGKPKCNLHSVRVDLLELAVKDAFNKFIKNPDKFNRVNLISKRVRDSSTIYKNKQQLIKARDELTQKMRNFDFNEVDFDVHLERYARDCNNQLETLNRHISNISFEIKERYSVEFFLYNVDDILSMMKHKDRDLLNDISSMFSFILVKDKENISFVIKTDELVDEKTNNELLRKLQYKTLMQSKVKTTVGDREYTMNYKVLLAFRKEA